MVGQILGIAQNDPLLLSAFERKDPHLERTAIDPLQQRGVLAPVQEVLVHPPGRLALPYRLVLGGQVVHERPTPVVVEAAERYNRWQTIARWSMFAAAVSIALMGLALAGGRISRDFRARHGAERMSQQMVLQTGVQVAGATSATLAQYSNLMVQAATLGVILAAVLLWATPYRIVWQSEFEKVEIQGMEENFLIRFRRP